MILPPSVKETTWRKGFGESVSMQALWNSDTLNIFVQIFAKNIELYIGYEEYLVQHSEKFFASVLN